VAVNVAAQVVGTALVAAWLAAHGWSAWYALTYGLWAGLVMSVRLDLSEPLAYALAAGALLAQQRGRPGVAAACAGAALLTKETTLAFWAALLAAAAARRDGRAVAAFGAGLLPFAGLQLALWRWFGAPGLGSGGYLATPFEWVPYMGLWRVVGVSLAAFALLAALWLPLVVAPSLWAAVAALRRLWQGDAAPVVWALGANAVVLMAAPFSTFREPLGIVRLATGLVLAVVLFGAHMGSRRVLTYALAWLSALALVIGE
jgi:hypothetical protein